MIEHDEVVSIIAELWWKVASGEIGSFRPRSPQTAYDDLNGYVAGCIDNEILRSMRQENAVCGISIPKGTKESITAIEANEDTLGHLEDDGSDPLHKLYQQSCPEVHAWAGGLGAMIEHYLDAARRMSVREARVARCRVLVKGGVGRPNLAWAVVMAGKDHNRPKSVRLAPMLVSRWVDGEGGSITDLRKKVYPHLCSDPEKTRLIANHEARALLRWLASECGNETNVTTEHLFLVAQDAAAAMIGWVGKRGPYKKHSAERESEAGQSRGDLQIEKPPYPEDAVVCANA
jgi:hypothetical protein